jgi:hypothetical protein
MPRKAISGFTAADHMLAKGLAGDFCVATYILVRISGYMNFRAQR